MWCYQVIERSTQEQISRQFGWLIACQHSGFNCRHIIIISSIRIFIIDKSHHRVIAHRIIVSIGMSYETEQKHHQLFRLSFVQCDSWCEEQKLVGVHCRKVVSGRVYDINSYDEYCIMGYNDSFRLVEVDESYSSVCVALFMYQTLVQGFMVLSQWMCRQHLFIALYQDWDFIVIEGLLSSISDWQEGVRVDLMLRFNVVFSVGVWLI